LLGDVAEADGPGRIVQPRQTTHAPAIGSPVTEPAGITAGRRPGRHPVPMGSSGGPGIGPASPYEPRLSVRARPGALKTVITISESTGSEGFDRCGPGPRPGETAADATPRRGPAGSDSVRSTPQWQITRADTDRQRRRTEGRTGS